jgi:hypothetical protein
MTTASEIQLRDRDIYPDEAVLSSVLGDSFRTYCDLLDLLKANNLTLEWRYYKDGNAWLCKVQKQKRTIIWMSACNGCMNATIYISEKHKTKFSQLDLSHKTLQTFFDSKPVGKIQPCTLEIRSGEVLSEFEKIMHFKIANK